MKKLILSCCLLGAMNGSAYASADYKHFVDNLIDVDNKLNQTIQGIETGDVNSIPLVESSSNKINDNKELISKAVEVNKKERQVQGKKLNNENLEMKSANLVQSRVQSKTDKMEKELKSTSSKDNINSEKHHVEMSFGMNHRSPMKGGTTCWDEAGKFHRVDPWLLRSIAKVESGFNPDAIGKNTNGTYDIGMMQINNKVWLPILKKKGITEQMLKDPCLSVYVGAWILRQNIDTYGWTARGIGAYNSRTPAKNIAYAKKVYKVYYAYKREYESKVDL